jgi:alkanesulfonate monooxygenase
LPALRASFYRHTPARYGAGPDFIVDEALRLEEDGFDSAYIPQSSTWPDVWSVTGWVLAATAKTRFVSAHRVGLQAPTAAARALATLDWLSGGRSALHVILGLSSDDQKRDGDSLPKQDRYRRAGEYLTVLRQWLTSAEPFDFEGEFYQVKNAERGVVPVQEPYPPISYGGASDESIALAARHADVYGLLREPLDTTAELVGRVREAAASHGRTIRFWQTGAFILGDTDDKAWAKAEAELSAVKDTQRADDNAPAHQLEGVLQQRVFTISQRGDRQDKALYTGISAATLGSSTPVLVGSPETVADSLLDYYDLGIEIFGLVPSSGATDAERPLSRELFKLLRDAVAERDRRSPNKSSSSTVAPSR